MFSSIAIYADWIATLLYALILIIAVFKLFIQRFIVCSKKYKFYSTTYGVTEWMRTTEFLDDEIVMTDHTSVSKLKYSNIQKIKEKNNVVIIFMNGNAALRLYKNAFIEGSWEACKKMILEKKKV
ncbi:MAG: YcxB family protein [Clostridia bacterium]|nr:YcxB family protein [Clostridia bacterium]